MAAGGEGGVGRDRHGLEEEEVMASQEEAATVGLHLTAVVGLHLTVVVGLHSTTIVTSIPRRHHGLQLLACLHLPRRHIHRPVITAAVALGGLLPKPLRKPA